MEVEPVEPKPEEAAAAAPAAAEAPTMEIDTSSGTTSAGAPNKKRKSEGVSKSLSIDPLGLPTTSKRERKSAAIFEAEDFQATAAAKAEARIHLDGRGTKLEDIPGTCESIKAAKLKSNELKMAHQLVFGGASKEKVRKQQLLEFSGYLPTKSADDEEEQKAIDEKLEVSLMSIHRLHDMSVHVLRSMPCSDHISNFFSRFTNNFIRYIKRGSMARRLVRFPILA